MPEVASELNSQINQIEGEDDMLEVMVEDAADEEVFAGV